MKNWASKVNNTDMTSLIQTTNEKGKRTSEEKDSKKTKTPPFSIQSYYRKDIRVDPPRKTGIFQPKSSIKSKFSYFYERGDFPIAVEHEAQYNKIAWKVSFNVFKVYMPHEYNHEVPLHSFFSNTKVCRHVLI